MTDTRELVDGWDDLKDNLPADGHEAAELLFDYGDKLADTITTISERNRRLTAVVEEIASRQTLSGHDGDLDWLIDDARAALTSGGRG